MTKIVTFDSRLSTLGPPAGEPSYEEVFGPSRPTHAHDDGTEPEGHDGRSHTHSPGEPLVHAVDYLKIFAKVFQAPDVV